MITPELGAGARSIGWARSAAAAAATPLTAPLFYQVNITSYITHMNARRGDANNAVAWPRVNAETALAHTARTLAATYGRQAVPLRVVDEAFFKEWGTRMKNAFGAKASDVMARYPNLCTLSRQWESHFATGPQTFVTFVAAAPGGAPSGDHYVPLAEQDRVYRARAAETSVTHGLAAGLLADGAPVLYRDSAGHIQPVAVTHVNHNVPAGEAPEISVQLPDGHIRDTELSRLIAAPAAGPAPATVAAAAPPAAPAGPVLLDSSNTPVRTRAGLVGQAAIMYTLLSAKGRLFGAPLRDLRILGAMKHSMEPRAMLCKNDWVPPERGGSKTEAEMTLELLRIRRENVLA